MSASATFVDPNGDSIVAAAGMCNIQHVVRVAVAV